MPRLSICIAPAVLLAFTLPVYSGSFSQTNLVSDIPGLAAVTDSQLVNPWGMAFSPTGPFWISDAGKGVSTLYTGTGQKQGLVVTTPPFGPTGQVFNATSSFLVGSSPASFIFSTLGGTIDGWNASAGTSASVMATVPGAVFTGLAETSNALGNVLLATDFRNNGIDTFNASFQKVSSSGSFVDPNLPLGYAPYNVAVINGSVFVAYAKVDTSTGRAATGVGLGFVSVFDLNGLFQKRLITQGPLDAPWGMALAPAGFGSFGGDFLVGNFGNGVINAFDPITGALLGTVSDALGVPIVNPGLWAIGFRTGGAGVNTNALYFTAGINGEADGLFGSIQATPEPGTLVLLSGAAMFIALRKRARGVTGTANS